MSKAKPKPNMTEVLQRLALPFGFHLTYLTKTDTMKVSGNLDHANQDHIAFAAGISGAELRIENWSKYTDQDRLVLLFTHFVVAVLRQFANSLESGDVRFTGSTEDGLLILSFRNKDSQEPAPDEP